MGKACRRVRHVWMRHVGARARNLAGSLLSVGVKVIMKLSKSFLVKMGNTYREVHIKRGNIFTGWTEIFSLSLHLFFINKFKTKTRTILPYFDNTIQYSVIFFKPLYIIY